MENMNRMNLPLLGKSGEDLFALDNDEPVKLDDFGEPQGLEFNDPLFEN